MCALGREVNATQSTPRLSGFGKYCINVATSSSRFESVIFGHLGQVSWGPPKSPLNPSPSPPPTSHPHLVLAPRGASSAREGAG